MMYDSHGRPMRLAYSMICFCYVLEFDIEFGCDKVRIDVPPQGSQLWWCKVYIAIYAVDFGLLSLLMHHLHFKRDLIYSPIFSNRASPDLRCKIYPEAQYVMVYINSFDNNTSFSHHRSIVNIYKVAIWRIIYHFQRVWVTISLLHNVSSGWFGRHP